MEFEKKQQRANVVRMLRAGVITTEEKELYLDDNNAIMGEPDLIILDEPINALDEQTVMSIKTELLKLRDNGKLIVIACHDREELEFLCDIIYEIKNGTVAGCEVIGE